MGCRGQRWPRSAASGSTSIDRRVSIGERAELPKQVFVGSVCISHTFLLGAGCFLARLLLWFDVRLCEGRINGFFAVRFDHGGVEHLKGMLNQWVIQDCLGCLSR